MHIDHFNIGAPFMVLEQVKDFYCEVLGLEVGFKPPSNNHGYWLYAAGNPKAIVHLSQRDERSMNSSHACLDHIALKMDCVDTLTTALVKHGVPYTINVVGDLSLTQIFFRDPSGLKIEANIDHVYY